MVRPSGIEPETLALEGRCSIQLSYGRFVSNFVEPLDYWPEDELFSPAS